MVRLKREAKAKGGFYVEAEPKLLFVIRIRGLNKIHPKASGCSREGSAVGAGAGLTTVAPMHARL